MAGTPKILLVGGEGEALGPLVPRLRALGAEVVVAEDVAEAIRALGEPDGSPRVVFFPTDGPAAERQRLFSAVYEAIRGGDACFVGVGPLPRGADLKGLRSAGVEIFLAEPIADAQLRFALNQAAHRAAGGKARRSARVATAIVARIVTGTGEREALVYSLSASGAYLETPRAAVAGARIEIALPLPGETVTVQARVLYHNVPGNLQQDKLAVGMGVEFAEMDDAARASLADYVDECLEAQTGRKTEKTRRAKRAEAAQARPGRTERRRLPRLEFLRRNETPEPPCRPIAPPHAKAAPAAALEPQLRPEPTAEPRARAQPQPRAEQAPAPRPEPKPEGRPAGKENRVVVRCRDGRLIKGYTYDFMPQRDLFHVVSLDDESDVIELSSSEPKAIFFVKDFVGERGRTALKRVGEEDLRGVPGLKLRVHFLDGEVLWGTTNGYQPGRQGFFVFPADETSNNERVYVYAAATRAVDTWR